MTFPSFAEFFETLTQHVPYPWQTDLAERACSGDWPDVVNVPTGFGKTSTVQIAVYALAHQVHHAVAPRTAPQRVVHVVNRRAVVDQTYGALLHNKLDGDGLAPVRDALLALAGPWAVDGAGTPRAVEIERVHGESPDTASWLRPTGACVLTLTPHQLVSRLGFRGYGVSARTRSIHAGLLGVDTLILFDEPHLSGQAIDTVRRMLAHQSGASTGLGVPPSRLVLVGATIPGSERAQSAVRLTEADTTSDHGRQVLEAPRPLRLVKAGTGEASVLRALVKSHAEERQRNPDRRIAVIVNTIDLAQQVYRQVRAEEPGAVLLTSRMRATDRRAAEQALGLDPSNAAQAPRTVVATQCLEVGVDLSFDALVTEACPLASLVQRIGRLNRDGKATEPQALLVMDGDPAKVRKGTEFVYGSDAVAATNDLLMRAATGGSIDFSLQSQLAFETAVSVQAPAPRLATFHGGYLGVMATTYPTPWSDYPLDSFITGPDEPDSLDVQVAWRADLDLLDDCPPLPGEMVSVPLPALRALLRGHGVVQFGDVEAGVGDEPTTARSDDASGSLKVRRDDVWQALPVRELRAGDLVVVDASVGGYSASEGWSPTSRAEVLDHSLVAAMERGRLGVSFPVSAETLVPWVIRSAFEGRAREHAVVKCLLDLLAAPDGWTSDEIRDHLADDAPSDLGVDGWSFTLRSGSSGQPQLIARIVREQKTGRGDEQLLDEHQRQVAAVADEACLAAGVAAELSARVVQAALWHDEGKRHESFQRYLGREEGAGDLGKSQRGRASRAVDRRLARACGHELAWRHEGESARRVAQALDDDLVVHLVGSHHGRFRPLLASRSDSVDQAELGGRAEAFDRLNRQWGPWGLAYLEAVVRLSDWQASAHRRKAPEPGDVVGGALPPGRVQALVKDSGGGVGLVGLLPSPLTGWFAVSALLRFAHSAGDRDATVHWTAAGGGPPSTPVWRSEVPLADVCRSLVDSEQWDLLTALGALLDGGLAKKYQKVQPLSVLEQVLTTNPAAWLVQGLLQDAVAAEKGVVVPLTMAAAANMSSYVGTALAALHMPACADRLMAAFLDPLAGWSEANCDGGMDRPGIDDGVTGREVKDHRMIRTALAPAALLGMAAFGTAGENGMGVRGKSLQVPLPMEPVTWPEMVARTRAIAGTRGWTLRYELRTYDKQQLWLGYPIQTGPVPH